MKTVLVTGGAGFVGRHFVRRFLSLGMHVTVIDDLSTGQRDPAWEGITAKQLIFIKTDCRNWFRHAPICDFDLVVHLAAVVGGRLKIDGDPLAVATDLAIDADFFNWLARAPQRPQVLYFSSSAAYPVYYQDAANGNSRLYESYISWVDAGIMPWLPDMTYGWAKLTGEYLAGFAARQYGIDVKIYRPFSGYGPGQSLAYPFPSILKRVINNESPVVVWGSGDQVRDFIYIDDIVDAVLETKDKLAPGETVNLGSGIGTSFRELAHRAAKVLGRQIEVINDSTKPEGVFARVANVTKFRKLYPKPLIPLDDGIARVALDLGASLV